MAPPSPSPASSRKRHDRNSYWKLSDYPDMRMCDIIEHLEKNQYIVNNRGVRREVLKLQHRLDRGLLCYEHESNSDQDLKTFIRDRHLLMPKRATRRTMAKVLLAGDDKLSFPKFGDLPAELRERIYGFYLSEFPPTLRSPSQPPLARASRLLRQEFLPIFYAQMTFEIRLASSHHFAPGTALSLSPCVQDKAWLMGIPAAYENCLRKLSLVIGTLHSCSGCPNGKQNKHHNFNQVGRANLELCNGGKTYKVNKVELVRRQRPWAEEAEKRIRACLAAALEVICSDSGSRKLGVSEISMLRKHMEDCFAK